jgi:hypothetical protein
LNGAPMDHFFFYGEDTLEQETASDLIIGLFQPKRSLSYSPLDGVGVTEYENLPTGFYAEINMKYDTVAWISRRNQAVSDGGGDSPDRRVATSQSIIRVESDVNRGEMDLLVNYVLFRSLKPGSVTLPIGGSV